MTTWYIGSQNPGTSTFLDTDLVAVNFWVRDSVTGLDAEDVKRAADGRHPEWDRKTAGVRTNFARQLELFASAMTVGDDVVTFDAANREQLLVGKVRSPYRYEDPSPVPDHPHLRDVEWVGTMRRADLPDAGASIEHVRGITVKQLWDAATPSTDSLDDAPPPPAAITTRRSSTTTKPDSFSWEPATGQHRYLLRQEFRGTSSDRPLLVVMLNPGANDMAGFRRSTTCHAVRRWGEAHGHDSAIYVNLFSHVEPNSSFLHRVAAKELNGPGADEAIERVGQELADGVALAGWGNLPPGLNRRRYDERVATVERLVGRPLMALGFTRDGYPRHGRGWRETDEPVPLRS